MSIKSLFIECNLPIDKCKNPCVIDEYTKERVCPRKYITPEVLQIISLFSAYKDGFLPASGGFYEQTAPYCELMLLCKQVYMAEEEKRTRKETANIKF